MNGTNGSDSKVHLTGLWNANAGQQAKHHSKHPQSVVSVQQQGLLTDRHVQVFYIKNKCGEHTLIHLHLIVYYLLNAG